MGSVSSGNHDGIRRPVAAWLTGTAWQRVVHTCQPEALSGCRVLSSRRFYDPSMTQDILDHRSLGMRQPSLHGCRRNTQTALQGNWNTPHSHIMYMNPIRLLGLQVHSRCKALLVDRTPKSSMQKDVQGGLLDACCHTMSHSGWRRSIAITPTPREWPTVHRWNGQGPLESDADYAGQPCMAWRSCQAMRHSVSVIRAVRHSEIQLSTCIRWDSWRALCVRELIMVACSPDMPHRGRHGDHA